MIAFSKTDLSHTLPRAIIGRGGGLLDALEHRSERIVEGPPSVAVFSVLARRDRGGSEGGEDDLVGERAALRGAAVDAAHANVLQIYEAK